MAFAGAVERPLSPVIRAASERGNVGIEMCNPGTAQNAAWLDLPWTNPPLRSIPFICSCPADFSLRTMPPPEGEASPVSYPDLEQRHPRENAAAAASPKYLETGAAIDLASGGKGGDASSMAQPHGGRGISGAAEGKSSTNEGTMGAGD